MSKLAIASIAGMSVAGTGGWGVYHFYFKESKPKDKSLRAKLVSEKFTILTDTTDNNQHWENLKTEYEKIKGDANKAFQVTSQAITTNTLKDLCKDHLDKEVEDLYSKVKKWCVVPVNISDHLRKLGFSPLSTETSGEPDKAGWERLAEGYNSSNEKVTGLEVANRGAWTTLRDKCKNWGDKKNYEDEFDANLKTSQRWCVPIKD